MGTFESEKKPAAGKKLAMGWLDDGEEIGGGMD
jgi:hypothetical protein